MAEREKEWHLRASVPIGIIAAIFFQAGCFISYASKLDSKVQETSTQVSELRIWKDKQADETSKILSHLAGVDQKLEDESTVLHRIDDRLDRALVRGK